MPGFTEGSHHGVARSIRQEAASENTRKLKERWARERQEQKEAREAARPSEQEFVDAVDEVLHELRGYLESEMDETPVITAEQAGDNKALKLLVERGVTRKEMKPIVYDNSRDKERARAELKMYLGYTEGEA